jgi:DNA polymerase-3 subunit epsilon
MSQPHYFKLRIGLSRGIEDATAKKSQCTYLVEYYYRDATGRLAKVTICEDGFVYRSAASFRQQINPAWPGKPGQKPAPAKWVEIPGDQLALPVGAEPCAEAEYDAALERVLAFEKKKEEERLKEKAFIESLKQGMLRAQHAAEEADVAEPLDLVPASHFLDDFTVFDTETTGTDPHRNRITELAAVRYQNWQEVGRMQSFVRCDQPVPRFITQLTGITDADLRHAPLPVAVLKQFRQLAGESLLVGHNVTFDLRMVEGARERLGAVQPLPNQSLCTWAVAATRYPGPHKLPGLCERFGIPSAGAHRAMVDVLMTAALLRLMHEQAPIGPELIGASARGKKPPVRKAAEPPTLFESAA